MTRSSHSVRSGVYDERGAVVPIIALSLIALLGMVVLVVDVGGLLYRKRQMVSASDAAALAAARSCVVGTLVGGSPDEQADAYAQANVEGIPVPGGIVERVGCETNREGYVTVEYSSTQNFSFAGIFGSSSGEVPARATAEWGGAAGGRPVPFVLSLSTSGGQTNVFCQDAAGNPVVVNEDVPLGTQCFAWYANGSGSGGSFEGFGGSVFGSLNLDKWGVDASFSCSNKNLPENRTYAANGGYTGTDPKVLNDPGPTWVCAGDGGNTSLYDDFKQSITKTLVFPVTDGQTIPPGETDPNKIDKFNVIGLAALRLDGVYKNTLSEAGGSQSPCNTWTGQVTPTTSLDLGVLSSACAPFDEIIITKVNGPNPCCQSSHYSYDPSTRILSFQVAQDFDNVTVEWDVFRNGPCGPKPTGAGHCLALSWQGIQFGNGPLGGVNVGVPAVRLCDRSIAGSCDVAS
jgi:Flp pilus assembly protein TadG